MCVIVTLVSLLVFNILICSPIKILKFHSFSYPLFFFFLQSLRSYGSLHEPDGGQFRRIVSVTDLSYEIYFQKCGFFGCKRFDASIKK